MALELSVEVALANATELARRGRYDDAEVVLSEAFPDSTKDVRAMDLRARMRAQQGRLGEAEDIWRNALALDPDNYGCQAGLQRIAGLQRRRLYPRFAIGLFATLCALALLVGGILLLRVPKDLKPAKREIAVMPTELGATVAPTKGLAEERNALAQELKQLREQLPGLQKAVELQSETVRNLQDTQESLTGLITPLQSQIPKLQATSDALAVKLTRLSSILGASEPGEVKSAEGLPPDIGLLGLNMPGVRLTHQQGELVASFESGLFGAGAQLTGQARGLLTEIGRRIAPHVGRLSIYVVGHTDDVPIPRGYAFADNESLAMARATAVVEHMRTSAQLPMSVFLVKSHGQSDAPYPNDSEENRRRNRTAVLRFSGLGPQAR